jgi:hypothetical protein
LLRESLVTDSIAPAPARPHPCSIGQSGLPPTPSDPLPNRYLLSGVVLWMAVLPAVGAAQAAATADPTVLVTRSPEPLAVPRLHGPITLDGRPDEAAWQTALRLPAVMQTPTFGAAPSEATEFLIAYDDDYLYFACIARDSDPKGIRAPSLKRDDGGFSSDWCTINLDTFNDKETALVFGTSPAGIRTDAVFADDGQAPGNFNWNAFWDAAVHRDPLGWSAEIRIPFTSLRFNDPDDAGRVIMGVAAWRLIARKIEVVTFPAISNQWGTTSMLRASRFQEVVLEGVSPRRPVYVTPYALGGQGRSHRLKADGATWMARDDDVHDLGLDLKYSPTSNLTLDLTVNTDFAQVEADDQQVNLTRFSLFFPEKRLFFQERAAIFDFSLGGHERLFHSRRIGIVAGHQVPILAGARVVGRVGDWDVGALNMQTRATALAPRENMGVLRVRRRALNENSYVGGIVTTRVSDASSARNLVYGLDARLRLFGQDYLTLNWAQSVEDDGAGALHREPDLAGALAGALDRGLARVAWVRRGLDGLVYDLELARVGADFEPGLGFLFRDAHARAVGRVSHGWRPGEASPLLRYAATLAGDVYRRAADGSVESARVQPQGTFQLKAGHAVTGAVTARYEDLTAAFHLSSEASVPAGDYRFAIASVTYAPPSADLFRLSLSAEAGGYFDGRLVSTSVSPTWNASKHLELTGTYRLDQVRFPDRDQAFAAHVARLRTEVRLDTRLSGAAFVQYNSAANLVSMNTRLRYNPAEGHDLYVVWNQGLNSDLDIREPRLPRTDTRTILVKYSRTFTLAGRAAR